jgi:transcription elongation GreA/GreB family factor
MLNPYVTLLVLCAFLGCMWWAQDYGYQRGNDAAELKYSRIKDAAHEALSKQLDVATKRADTAERNARVAAARRSAIEATLAPSLEGIRNAKAIPANCIDNDMRMRINSAIKTINATANPKIDYTLRMPAKLPSATESGG